MDVLPANAIKAGEMKQVKPMEKRILLTNLDGKLYAIGEVCTHKGCALSNGTLKGENVTCPCHGSTFNVKTGEVLRGPAKNPEPTFEVKTENNRVYVKI